MSIGSGVRLDEQDESLGLLSGTDLVDEIEEITIPTNRQMINFTILTVDGILTLDGDLWLA
jgi:hypothetical protein